MFKRIDHVEIVPIDLKRSLNFYTEVLGFNLEKRQKVDISPLKQYLFLRLGDTRLELLEVDDAATMPGKIWQTGYRMMAIEVENMDKTIEYLRSKGVKPCWGPVNLGGPKRAEIKDPDGLHIELRQW